MGSVPELPATLRILDSSPMYALGELERVVIADWRLQPTEYEFDRRNAALLDLADRFPGACAYLEMIEPTSKPPPAPLRKSGMDVFRQLGSRLSCVAIVVHGAELRVTFVRAILSGMTFIVPQVQPLRVFKNTDAAARWMQGRLGAGSDFERRVSTAAEALRPPRTSTLQQHP